jgi:hypothetical protein
MTLEVNLEQVHGDEVQVARASRHLCGVLVMQNAAHAGAVEDLGAG